MSAWTENELRSIGEAQELEIAPVRRNGDLRRSTPIWVVRVGDDLFVRAAYGSGSGWYGVAQTSRQARISAGGVERDVTIEDGDESVLDAVDAGYRDKYGSYASIVDSITDAEHRATTVRLVKE
ncbi:MAG: DUF2255 family protein [Actinomycetota bacterium]|nr:DUF2255 family protein [Actinomycetota bacterium]